MVTIQLGRKIYVFDGYDGDQPHFGVIGDRWPNDERRDELVARHYRLPRSLVERAAVWLYARLHRFLWQRGFDPRRAEFS